MKKIIVLILMGIVLITGCQQSTVDSKSENKVNESKEVEFNDIPYSKMLDSMVGTINEKAKVILDDKKLNYDEYEKLVFAGRTYIVKGTRHEISIEDYKEKYPNAPIPEAIGEYKIKTIVVGSTLSSPYFSIANEEEKAQIMSEGIDKEKYKIQQTAAPIMELLYEKGESGLSVTIQDTNLLKLCTNEELNSIYSFMAIHEVTTSDTKESKEDKNLRAYYSEENKKYKGVAIYQEENSNIVTKIAVGKLDKIDAYGVGYEAIAVDESDEISPIFMEVVKVIKDVKLP
ncbi:MAG: hypothetical protein ACRDA4_08350 [Filifactoraceae bacterium]